MRRGGVGLVRRHADRPLRGAGQSAAGLALAGAGLGDDAGAARVVSRDGGARRDGADSRSRRRWTAISALADAASADGMPIGYVLSLEGADSIVTLAHLERAYAQGLRAVGPAHYGPGVYAQGTHASGGLGAPRPRAAARDGAARHHPRRHASVRRELSRGARSFPRPGLGEPHQLPRARAARPAVLRRPDPRADRARRRHRRGVRRLDARARTGCAARRRPSAPA